MSDTDDPGDTRDGAKEPTYTLSLQGDGITLKRELTREVALAVINIALGGVTAAPPSGGRSGETPAPPGGGRGGSTPIGASAPPIDGTPGEYIEETKARTNADKIVAFGAYLHDHKDQQRFTRVEIKGLFRAAHETPPANFGRDFRAALSSKGIAEDTPDQHFVTKTGRGMLEQEFTAPRPVRRARRQATGSSDKGT